jgi:adenine-specific DNA-methyltransferase
MAKEKVEFDKLNLKSQTKDLTNLNIDKISAIFPNVIREKEDEAGNITKGVDFDLLKQLLSKELVDGPREKYHLDWPGKKASLLKANTPITETLRPDIANSKNWDNTKNVFIEGDNFKTLKILQESYLGKIKMIYIDPPYNTGKDFVYSDKFTINKSEYAEKIGQYDEEKNKLFKENFKTNPRYHSDWLSMMYERLHIARDLLRDDGVIFISIDDNEVHNLRKICDEIFGEENFVAQISVENNPKGRKNSNYVSISNDFCLIYCRNKSLEGSYFIENIPKDPTDIQIDEEGRKYTHGKRVLVGTSSNNKVDDYNSSKHYSVYYNANSQELKILKEHTIDESNKQLIKEGFKRYISTQNDNFLENTYSDKELLSLFGNKALIFKENSIYEKDFNPFVRIKSLLTNSKIKGIDLKTETAGKDLRSLGIEFDNPKNFSFIQTLLTLLQEEDFIILDFFAGSGTTAHAVMAQNAEDGGNRKYIMVQLDEETDEKSEAYKDGYKTIAELSRERIRRAGEKIVADLKSKQSSSDLKVTSSKGGQDNTTDQTTSELDIGFRAFRVDSSNMKDIRLHPANIKQQDLMQLVDTIKADRSGEDLLIQVLLDKALTLDLPIKSMKFKQNTVYIVGENDLIICMDPILDISIVDDLAKLGADTAVFRDSSFANENDRIQLDTSFKTLSPRDTKIMVI